MPFVKLFPPLAYPVVQHRTIPLASHQLSGFRFVALLHPPQTSSHTKSLKCRTAKTHVQCLMVSQKETTFYLGFLWTWAIGARRARRARGTTHAGHWRVHPCDA